MLIGSRYQRTELLGQGGMATVYKGLDTITGKPVALKLLKSEFVALEPEIVGRFEREGEALRVLNHPNIVKVLASIVEGDDHYVIMEYVGGGDLARLLENYRKRETLMPVDRILEIGLDLSDALARAHRLQIIHRDIKPANVLLAEDGTPRLTDFGVAHIGGSTRMTETGSVLGTLAYLSPEACAGQDLDIRADIWSFGVMLYEMLALQRPFDENNSAALLHAILNKTPVSLPELRPDIPPGLAVLVESMLVKDRHQRVGSARLVGAQLEALISGSDPVEITPTSSRVQVPPGVDHGEFIPDDPPTREQLLITQSSSPRRPIWLFALPIMLIVVLTLAAVLASGALEVESNTSTPVPTVVPVADGQYTVLVASMERVGGESRDVSRFIADDLHARFEEDVPFSNIAIRRYEGIITTSEQAVEIANASDASLIIWGNYDIEAVNVEVQLGSLVDFPDLLFDRSDIEVLSNARLRMTNERRETLAFSIVAAMNILHTANTDSYGVGQNLAILNLIDEPPAEVIGNSAAAHWHRYLGLYFADDETALASVTEAVKLLPRHPIPYQGRSLVYNQLGRFDEALQDVYTSLEVGPTDWAMPYAIVGQYMLYYENDFEAAIEAHSTALELRPNDWWDLTFRGINYYAIGDFENARQDFVDAIQLEPEANFPYVFAASIALREGELGTAQELLQFIRDNFPDPAFARRLMDAAYGDVVYGTEFVAGAEAVGYFVLGQWNEVLRVVDETLGIRPTFTDFYLIDGLAHCNLQNYAEAEASYTQLIRREPDYTLAYLLRAEARMRQSKTELASADMAQIIRQREGAQFAPFVQAFRNGDITCENLLDVAVP